jgi:tripartite-type tricarboxylate transporter receptor subunit TctC
MRQLAHLFAIVGVFAQVTQAQAYPNRPITLVVPLGAGATMDIIARGLGQRLSEPLGKPVVVENRTGGATIIAATALAKATPDGHTLMIAPSATLTSHAKIYKRLPYDPGKDFVPLALMSTLPFVLVVNPALPLYSAADLINFAKQKPDVLTFASNGKGQAPHLAGELLQSKTGIRASHVPYRGMPQAIADVLAGHVHLLFADPVTAIPLIRDGKLRALGVSSLDRAPFLSEVPTLAEQGVSEFEIVSWQMIIAPIKTPSDTVKRLHFEINRIAASPEFKDGLIKMGLSPVERMSVEGLRRFLNAEIERWGKLVEQAGLANSE